MTDQSGVHIIQSLRQKWQRNYLFGSLLLALASSVFLITLISIAIGASWPLIIAASILPALIVFVFRPFRRISAEDITGSLNRHYPELEESSHLLLLPPDALNFLQQLQKQKLEAVITEVHSPKAMNTPLKRSSLVLISVIAACIAIIVVREIIYSKGNTSRDIKPVDEQLNEIIPAGIKNFTVTISPPSYTRRPQRKQEQFTLKVEEGSIVTWDIQTTAPIDSLGFRFNNKETAGLKKPATNNDGWTLQRTISESGYYQVELPGNTSVLYTIEVIHDQPADIKVLSPQQYTTVEPGRKPVSDLRVRITDDYGIQQAQIIATKASGKGESVSFKEQQLSFPIRFDGRKEVETSRLLDLAAMGMQGGDELYFYIKVTDSHGQESRSDMHFISLPDTAELLSLSGMESGIDQFPEYFRSQRQIIIDTEKLLKEQSSIAKESFNARSNELGAEQKLLRLRYGKFLGEENESGGGGDHSPDDGHDHGHDDHEEPAYGDVQSLIDQYAHKHDNAEDATYFEPAQKAQLKAILTEMWNSELRLRTYVPAEALPYQYKALRLLKDLQQKSRAYVSKTSIKMPPLKPEKRLTGNLEKVQPASETGKNVAADKQIDQLRLAVSTLEKIRQRLQPAIEEQATLIAAEKAIAEKAIARPSEFLPALSSIRAVTASPASASRQQIASAQHALQQIIQTETQLPQRVSSRPGSLSDHYFKKLNPGR